MTYLEEFGLTAEDAADMNSDSVMKTFYVIYIDANGDEQSQEIEFDTTGYTEEDFWGGAGSEAIESIWQKTCPDGEMQSLEVA